MLTIAYWVGGEIQGMIQRLFNQRCALESQFLNIHLAILLETFLAWWKRDPFQGLFVTSNDRGWKGHELNHLVRCLYQQLNPKSHPQNPQEKSKVVVSNIFYFHPYLGKWSNLTNIFQMGWNHQLVYIEQATQHPSTLFHENPFMVFEPFSLLIGTGTTPIHLAP